jgi:hypothetical protein
MTKDTSGNLKGFGKNEDKFKIVDFNVWESKTFCEEFSGNIL